MKKFLLPFFLVMGSSSFLFAQNQRFSLIEEFSGENCAPCASKNPAFWTKISAPGNESKVVLLKYQAPIPSAGPIYNENRVFTNSRMDYYSVPFAPYGRINGANIGSTGDIASLTPLMIQTAYDNLTPFLVSVGNPVYDAANNNTFTLTVTVTASSATTVANGRLRLALAEHLSFTTPPGSNGEMEFHNVVRQMYPSESGLTLDASWTAGQVRTYTFTGQIPHYVKPTASERFFVGWIQNETNKEILQAGKTGNVTISIPQAGAALSSLTIGENLQCGIPATISSHTVSLKNTGTSTLTSAKIYYKVGTAGTWTEHSWTGSLAAGASATVTMPSVTITASGMNPIIDSVAAPNGQVYYNDYDNVVSGNVTVLESEVNALPISFGFESDNPKFVAYATGGFGVPFYIYNGSGAGYNGSGKFLYVPLYNYVAGVNGYHIMPKPDLSASGSKAFDFYVAYAQMTNENDKLEVVYTNDCGATWTSIWSKQGNDLRTSAPNSSTAFVPSSNSQWRKESVDITSVPAGSFIALKYTGDNGNGLFVDDITIRTGETSSIEEIFAGSSFDIYPNPVSNELNVRFELLASLKSTINIYNSIGQIVYSEDRSFNKGLNNFSINTASIPTGNYIISIQSEDGSVNNKFIKQ